MKDKKEKQNKKRQEHLERRKAAKRRKRGVEPVLERAEPEKAEKQKILIVCEGTNTEPSYFNKFKLTSATIKAVGEGYNTISLVNRAIQLSKEGEYDQVWCVFDKDDFPNNNFNNAVFKAEGAGFKLAYSNQAFEYWLILHFEDHQGGSMHRNDYCNKLNNYLKEFGVNYDCDSKGISDEIFDVLVSKSEDTNMTRQELACRRAQRIIENYDNKNPANEESSTKVHRLVEEIEKYR